MTQSAIPMPPDKEAKPSVVGTTPVRPAEEVKKTDAAEGPPKKADTKS